jgi:hypothetical protein
MGRFSYKSGAAPKVAAAGRPESMRTHAVRVPVRAIDPPPVRLVAPPQMVRGVRFRLRCDATTPESLRDRCPAGTVFAPASQP